MPYNLHIWGDDGKQIALKRYKLSDGTGAKNMIKKKPSGITRRGLLGAFAATAVVATPTYSNAAGFLRGAGDVRRIAMHSGRTGERLNTIYWIDGEYIGEAVREINMHMRDWRTGEAVQMDLRTIDIMSAALNMMDTSEPYLLLSGYRSPSTNRMLRASNQGVASNSLHMVGQAADLRLASRTTTQMSAAALSCNAGGVGRYGRSNFVHMDCGPIRSWRG
ncbi:MAG: hypothetical protein ACJAVT_000302 [Yoonia sp.]|jgi:uncharacterized protein YcbK (DUF882 family)